MIVYKLLTRRNGALRSVSYPMTWIPGRWHFPRKLPFGPICSPRWIHVYEHSYQALLNLGVHHLILRDECLKELELWEAEAPDFWTKRMVDKIGVWAVKLLRQTFFPHPVAGKVPGTYCECINCRYVTKQSRIS